MANMNQRIVNGSFLALGLLLAFLLNHFLVFLADVFRAGAGSWTIIAALALSAAAVYGLWRVRMVNTYALEIITELKRVTFPTFKDSLASTVIVIIVVFIIALFLGLVDFGLSEMVKAFLG